MPPAANEKFVFFSSEKLTERWHHEPHAHLGFLQMPRDYNCHMTDEMTPEQAAGWVKNLMERLSHVGFQSTLPALREAEISEGLKRGLKLVEKLPGRPTKRPRRRFSELSSCSEPRLP